MSDNRAPSGAQEIVEEIAAIDPIVEGWWCFFCTRKVEKDGHEPDCLWVRAKVARAERAEPAGAEFFASDVDFLDRCLNWSVMPYDVWLARCRDLRDRIRQHIAAVQPPREGDK